MTPLAKTRDVLVFAVLSSWTAAAAAQVPGQEPLTTWSLAAVTSSVPLGDAVAVTDATGGTAKGSFAGVNETGLQVRVRDRLVSIAAADVRRIQWQRPDSPLTGMLIGAAIGAVPGIYWLIADPNECTGMCPEEYAVIAMGAAIGALIDHSIKKKVTVYAAAGGSSPRAHGGMMRPNRKGVLVSVRF
jgi:hypothetical protein